ncbi:MAG: transposase [Bdellovibrionota bacterium]
MKRQRRSFPFEFKKMIVELADSGQYTINQIARDHEIAPGLIVQWREKLNSGELIQPPSYKERQLEIELERYKKKVGELTIVVDVLKKHLSSFPSVRRLSSSLESPRTLVVLDKPAKY